MRRFAFLGLAAMALTAVSDFAVAGSRARYESFYFPANGTYDSHGRVAMVRQVQRALEEDGYYVGDNRGNYIWDTRVAVRRYQRDNGLPITGKIDRALLTTLGLR